MSIDLSFLDGERQPTPEEDQAENQRQLYNSALAQWELTRLFSDVFGTGRGPELLQYFRDCTVDLPTMQLSTHFGSNDFPVNPAEWVFLRAGENRVVHEIERRLKLALAGPPEAPKSEPQPQGEQS